MKIGILGGSFDPIHTAHLQLAKLAQKFFLLDQVVFMVSALPPHKRHCVRAANYHRYAMVSLALRHEESFLASTLELERSAPSYTIDTLRQWKSLHPQDEFCFLAGGDSLVQIHCWKDYGRLLTDYSFVFVGRRGVEIDLEGLPIEPHLKHRIQVCDTAQPQLEPGQSYLIKSRLPLPASSTDIRASLEKGQAPDFLDPVVLAYVRKHHLYE